MKISLAVLFVVGGLIVGSFLAVFAQTPPGVGIGPYMRRGVDARASAMGGAFVAMAEGGSAGYYNPAGLTGITDLCLGGMYSEPYGHDFGVSFQYVSALGPLTTQTDSVVRDIGVGVTWLNVKIDGIPIWSEYGSEGTFAATSSLYIVSAGIPFPGNDKVSVGGSLKYYHASILEGRSDGLGFDLSMLLDLCLADIPFTIGINAVDIGGTSVYWTDTSGEPVNYVPWINRIGVVARLIDGKALLAADFDWAVGRPKEEQKFHTGIEIKPIDAISLRAGWSTNLTEEGRPSVGIGVRLLDRLTVDYAYLPGAIFGATHLVSLNLYL